VDYKEVSAHGKHDAKTGRLRLSDNTPLTFVPV